MGDRAASTEDADKWWGAWYERLEAGEDPTEFVQEFSDEALVSLLASAGKERPTARNLVLAETLRRTSGLPSERSAAAAQSLNASVHQASAGVNEAAQRVHETEAAVEAKSGATRRGGGSEAPDTAHAASRDIERLRDLTKEAERKADELLRIHRTGMFVTPGRTGNEADDEDKGHHDE